MAYCPNLEGCPFVKKYGEDNYSIKGFVNSYCKGDKQNECERKKHYDKYNEAPPVNMIPNGHLLDY